MGAQTGQDVRIGQYRPRSVVANGVDPAFGALDGDRLRMSGAVGRTGLRHAVRRSAKAFPIGKLSNHTAVLRTTATTFGSRVQVRASELVSGSGRRTAELAPAPTGGLLKRAFDIVLAGSALVLLLPVLVIVAAAVWLTSGGPVVFAQDRVGFGGRLFRCYKFRSMCRDSQARLERHLAACPDAAEEWARTQKLTHDPRITQLGHFLRKSSLDELPQLWNVLRGEMSCMGPRPVVPEELKRYGAYRADYLRARPGITGMWQVSGRSTLTYDQRVALDRVYTRRWTFLGDILIALKTLVVVFDTRTTS